MGRRWEDREFSRFDGDLFALIGEHLGENPNNFDLSGPLGTLLDALEAGYIAGYEREALEVERRLWHGALPRAGDLPRWGDDVQPFGRGT
jgi:hypothetical protein